MTEFHLAIESNLDKKKIESIQDKQKVWSLEREVQIPNKVKRNKDNIV